MARVCVPEGAIAGMDIGGRRYMAKNGVIDVPDRFVHDLVKLDDCFVPSNQAAGAQGFTCTTCGFNAWIRTCGRCGGECVRPNEVHQQEGA